MRGGYPISGKAYTAYWHDAGLRPKVVRLPRKLVTVWVFVVSTFLAVGGAQVGVVGQARHKSLAKFVFPTPVSCEAARTGVREFADTAGQTLMIGLCQEETRSPRVWVGGPES